MSYRIESQLNEDQIETDVSSYLGFITPFWSRRFRLISVDEQATGADKLFDRFVPIYMQFKVSHGLNPNSSLIQKYLNKPLTNIIDYRKNNNLSGNPILYFQLRKQAKTATDLQHNILFKLNSAPNQYGLYIAPLTLDLSEYERQLNGDWHFRFYQHDPLGLREIELNDTNVRRNLSLGTNPFLRHHISIPPHALVTTHKHHYSFSISGGDLAWHGGETLNGDFRLSYQFNRILFNSYYNRELGMTQKQYSDFILEFSNENLMSDFSNYNDNNPSYNISYFSNYLKEKFGITLMFLMEARQ